jgi:hypothetical protein
LFTGQGKEGVKISDWQDKDSYDKNYGKEDGSVWVNMCDEGRHA